MTDKVTIAIERIKEGALMAERFTGKPMVVCYSGGKDSDVLLHLAIRAGVEMVVQNSHTSCDAPETVRHIRQVFARLEDQGIPCRIVYPMYKGKRATMWSLIAEKGIPPTKFMRYCCSILKESANTDRLIATGVRWDESTARRKRAAFETTAKRKEDKILCNDNCEARRLFETCMKKREYVCNPIIDWTHSDVWSYIRENDVPHNPLYDEGFTRIGCIGCPMGRYRGMTKEFARWPKYKQMYIHAFERMLDTRRKKGLDTVWETAEEVMRWWMQDPNADGQLTMEKIIAMEAEADD